MRGVENVALAYVPREPFKAFHARTQRLALLVYHRRAGKTVATVNDLVDKALHCRKPRGFFAYVSPFMGQAEQTSWAYLKDAVRTIPGHTVNETKKFVTVPSDHGTAATIRLFGADNSNALRGLYFDGVVLDEVADMDRAVWFEVIRPALMDRRGWAVFIGTPKGKNFFYDLHETARKHPEKWFLQVLKASESRLIPKEELEQYADEVDEETYQQEMECSFTAGIKGAYWASIISKMEQEGRLLPFDVVQAAPVHVVLDLGWSDATAAWFFQLVNGELRIVDHDEWTEVDIASIIKDIAARGYRMGNWWLPHDAKAKSLQTGKSMIEQFRSHGINPRAVPELSVLDGIQAVRLTLQKAVINSEKCYQGIESLKNYKKKLISENPVVYSKHPVHDWASHSADSFRYLCLAVRDQDIAKSSIRPSTPETPDQARDAWLASRSVNTPQYKGPTLDQLFARQQRRGSGYGRI